MLYLRINEHWRKQEGMPLLEFSPLEMGVYLEFLRNVAPELSS